MEKPDKEIPPNAAGPAFFALLRAWATELGADWDEVLKTAGITDSGRSTKNRMAKGNASLATARDISRALQKLSEKRGVTARVGPQALQMPEWNELGARLALADPDLFADILDRVRKMVAGAEARATGPFTRAAK